MKQLFLRMAFILILGADLVSGQLPKSPVDSYNSDCNNCLTFNGLEKPLKCAKNIQQENQELEMGEVLVKGEEAKAEEKQPALYSDKFAGAKTIHEHFAWNLAKATDTMGQDRLDLTKGERIELIDILRDHAEYEVEGDRFSIIGAKVSTAFEQVLTKFDLDDAKTRIAGFAEKRMGKSEEVEAMKKYGVHAEFKTIVNKALLDAVDSFIAQKNGKQVEVAQKEESVPASEINGTLVTQEASVAPSK